MSPTSHSRSQVVDAVVVGAGHHGLVAAAVLADAGWDVVALESRQVSGGAVASTASHGWIQDDFSSCYPLAAVSPPLRRLELERYGLTWSHAPRPLAHLGGTTPPATVWPDPARTAAALDADHPGDGDVWLRLVTQWSRLREPLMGALLNRWPPVADPVRLLARLGLRSSPDFARFLLLPVTRMGQELFGGTMGRDLLSGNAMHADIPPDAPGSGLFGWVMTMLAQDVGMPAPVGGAGALAAALQARAETAGAQIRTGVTVSAIEVGAGRATAVRTGDGTRLRARRAIIADTGAPALYRDLLPADAVPPGLSTRLDRFLWDLPTLKLNYRLDAPVPWSEPAGVGAGVIHLGRDHRDLADWATDLESDRVPVRPFLLLGQMSTIDPSRSPAGTETLWAYTHLPRRGCAPEEVQGLVERTEDLLAREAPGFSELVRHRWIQTPTDLAAADANLAGGAVGGGTMQLFQQAIWRPVSGLGGPRTHIAGLYLGSAAIHPGGGVHGACGHLAARAALADARIATRAGGAAARRLLRALYADAQGQPARSDRATGSLPQTSP